MPESIKKQPRINEKENDSATMAESNRLSLETVIPTRSTGRTERDVRNRRGEGLSWRKIVSVFPSKSMLLRSLGLASKVKKRQWQLHPVLCLLTERRLLFAAQAAQ